MFILYKAPAPSPIPLPPRTPHLTRSYQRSLYQQETTLQFLWEAFPVLPRHKSRQGIFHLSLCCLYWLFLLTYTLVHLRLAISTASQSCVKIKRQVCPHAAPAKAPGSFEPLVKEAGTQAPAAPHHAIAAMAMARSKQNVEPATERARCRIHRLTSVLAWRQDPRRLISPRRDSWPTRTFMSTPGFGLIGRGAKSISCHETDLRFGIGDLLMLASPSWAPSNGDILRSEG